MLEDFNFSFHWQIIIQKASTSPYLVVNVCVCLCVGGGGGGGGGGVYRGGCTS